ncbi:putative redox protein, regulator of disulfide bond formation [Halanaeroarchaeum sp. HSR-CO]|uniref:OsmC family protein n=1 Tax=Halanaeroarchaeum sp. HSR-CO TaxID=2866382 RepID=UPI00217E81DC|nr:OsmC family protein [Halanaeroarchaeum sp. HSR-CO]UWG48665.1 putative redox protein, regulator of disulfide bond formation [Halanaeroarchaeum sp. HSR-CO]
MSQQATTDERLATFAVQAESEGPTHTVVQARDFEFSVDEPEHLGGSNSGPNPVEYLLGALAGCLNVVGHTVADEMDMPVDDLEVDIEGDLDPAKFLGKDPEPRAGYQTVRVDLSVATDADPSTVETWLESVEERCPLSDNIANTTPIDFTVDTE